MIYEPGELKLIAYKNGKQWAEDVVKTTGEAYQIKLLADRQTIHSDGKDLSFITVEIKDKNGFVVPDADNTLGFSIEGPGEIVATDNGDPSSLVSFAFSERPAFNGLCLVIVRANANQPGIIKLKAASPTLKGAIILLRTVSNK